LVDSRSRRTSASVKIKWARNREESKYGAVSGGKRPGSQDCWEPESAIPQAPEVVLRKHAVRNIRVSPEQIGGPGQVLRFFEEAQWLS